MTARAARLAVLAAVLLAAFPAPAASAGGRDRSCGDRGTTVARNLHFRVFETERDGWHVLRACRKATGRRVRLASWFSCDCSIGDEQPARVSALSGRFAAVVEPYGCEPGGPCSAPDLLVADLRRGRVVHAVAGGGGASGLLLKANGSVAYVIGERLERRDGTGSAVLDEGPGIDPGSLAAGGGRLYWMHGDEPRTAPFG